MKLAVNYSRAAASLHLSNEIKCDLFKCPAWTDVIDEARKQHSVYVHFPLSVGTGKGEAIDTESGHPVAWADIERMMVETDTLFVNLHLNPALASYPEVPFETTESTHIEMITENLIRDVQAVVRLFGSDRVIAENVHNGGGANLQPVYLPEVISQVIEETKCGFLFDLSHAQLAANHLGVGIYDYIDALPTLALREIHVTGIQRFDDHWVEFARSAGFDEDTIVRYRGQLVDHLPMTEGDWDFFSWSIEQINKGFWGRPWVVTFEYGGVGGTFAPFTDPEVLRDQVPRLYEIVNEGKKQEDPPAAQRH